MFRGKKEKKSHVALGLVELKGDDVTMTELEKKNTILSDGFFPPPPPEVSFSCLVCLSKWRRVTLELFCHRWKLILSTQQQPPRYFCSSVSPVPCKRTPQVPSGIWNISRSFVDCFFRWILLSLLISSRITLHWLFWKKLIKMNGVWMVSRNRFSNAGIIYIESDRSWLLINRLEMKMGIVSTMNDFFHSWNYDLNIANTNSYSSNTKIV